MCEWIAVTECTPAEDYVVIASWYNRKTGKQCVFEAQLSLGKWASEQEMPGWEVTHWAHFPDPPNLYEQATLEMSSATV